jgi:hypothetical protein
MLRGGGSVGPCRVVYVRTGALLVKSLVRNAVGLIIKAVVIRYLYMSCIVINDCLYIHKECLINQLV